MKIILASQSPRRQELLGNMGLTFTVKPSQMDESGFDGLPAEELVSVLSAGKARWVSEREDGDTLVIGADTVVVLENEILGKPENEQQAAEMLRKLSGRTHAVYTGVTVCRGEESLTRTEKTEVTFAELTGEEIAEYIRTGEPMDKAGSYGIQGYGGMLVKEIHGDYSNVVGLPVRCVSRMLLAFGVNCMKLAAEKM